MFRRWGGSLRPAPQRSICQEIGRFPEMDPWEKPENYWRSAGWLNRLK